MAETPVDPGSSPDPKPLGLSLGFIEGTALVSLADRTLAEGFVIRALDLELAEVEFPLDLKGGAEEFQRRSTTLRTLVVDVHVELIARLLTDALSQTKTPVRSVDLRASADRLILEARIDSDGTYATFIAEVLLGQGEDRTVRFHFVDPIIIGDASIDAWAVPAHLTQAAKNAIEAKSERAAESVTSSSPTTIAIDVADAVLWSLMPVHGWKVPGHEGRPLRNVSITPSGSIRVGIGRPTEKGEDGKGTPTNDDDLLRAAARDDIERTILSARSRAANGDAAGAFFEMRDKLDASGGPDALVDRLFALGVATPSVFEDVLDLTRDRLTRDPTNARAVIAQAGIAAHEGREGEASTYYETAGRLLRDAGLRRHSGLAFRTAASYVTSQRTSEERKRNVRLLEETIALRPDDTVALAELVESLPHLDRAAAAVRAARRLANLARDPKTRARAHVRAGELLCDPLGDPRQAKRELERALRITPEDPRALEALARAVMEQGDTRRAASIFERLIDAAERNNDRARASRLSVVLGDLWRELDASAALVRYQHARELDGSNISALARLASASVAQGRPEAAMEAVEAALPMLEDGRIGGDRQAALELRLAAGRLYEQHADLLDEAIVQYDAALALAPEASDALMALSRLYARQGSVSHRADVIGRHAHLLLESGDLDAAATQWVEQAQILRDDPEGLERIRSAIIDALVHDRTHRGLLDALVDVARLGGDPATSIDAIDRRLLLDDPPTMRAHLLTRLGAAFESAGREVEATRAYEEAIAADERAKDAVLALVRIYRARVDEERLTFVLVRAADLADTQLERAGLLKERATLLMKAGRDDQAYDAAVASIEAAPDSPQTLPLATTLAIKLGRFEDAHRYASRRLAESKHDSHKRRLAIFVDLARIAEALENRDDLIHALENARDLADPESETGRQLAARLARELYGAERLDELAELQRRRGRVATAPAPERAERFIEAARLSARLGHDSAIERDISEALSLLGPKDAPLKLTALDILEASARRQDDPMRLSDVLGRRAEVVVDADDKERLRLEQADALERSEAFDAAVNALSAASIDLPSSLAVAERLGRAAARANASNVAAEAYGRAAKIAESRGAIETAIEMHGRAAETYALAGRRDEAAAHDRALVEHCAPGVRSPWLTGAMERLERFGRDKTDSALLADVLGRRALIAEPEDAARMLLEKAEVHAETEGAEREALDALRRARNLSPADSKIAALVDDRLVEMLERLGLHAEQAAVLVECADRQRENARRAVLYYRAAVIYAERLRDRGMALSRAQAAVRADPNHDEARTLRIELLRAGGRREALAEALAEEAELCSDAARAAELWLEAAEIITPLSDLPRRERALDQREIEHSLALARRAATAAPKSPEPLLAAAAYARALDRPDDELVALGHLVGRDVDPLTRWSTQIRRIDLLAGPLQQPHDAQNELLVLLPALSQLAPAQRAEVDETLLPDTCARLGMDQHETAVVALIHTGLKVTESNEDWGAHVGMLMSLVDVSADAEARADLRTRAGGVLEWKLGDGAGAEREYLAALALLPNHPRTREALENFYVAVDRFGDLAENLGLKTLVRVWNDIKDRDAPNRVISAAEALWPILEEGGDQRADVQLRLGDLYVNRDPEGADAVHILEQIVQTGPRRHQDAALERLRVFFLENDRADLYCDVLRRQAERVEENTARALALSELGDALEWKLGDGPAAESEYRAALAADPQCEEAKQRLAKLLSSQDRFEELGRDLGVDELEEVVDALLGQGGRDRERAIAAADALASSLPAERVGAMWLHVADAFEVDEIEPTDRAMRTALQRAGAVEGPNQKQALARLCAWLARADDRGELANVLRRRIEIERDPALKGPLHLELGRLVMSMLDDVEEELGREAIEEEAERELRSALALSSKDEEVRALLERLYLLRDRYLELGRVLGRDVLLRLRSEAESGHDVRRTRGAVAALAEMSEGHERASLLVELVGHADDSAGQPGLPRTPEDLYRAALVADEAHGPAREGLRALLESEGRYREIAEALDVTALLDTVDALRRQDDDRGQLLPASLSLVHVLDEEGAPARSRAALWTEIADLHLADDDVDAAEHALRAALRLDRGHEGARVAIRELFVAEERLVDLAEIDEQLVAVTAQLASESGHVDLQVHALDVLASRRTTESRADTLVLISALERERGHVQAAESRLLDALETHPPHKLARAELEAFLWSSKRYEDLVERLGSDALVARMERELDAHPEVVREAAQATSEAISAADRARALELTAKIEGYPARQLADLERARDIWDELEEPEGRARVRMAIVALRRDGDDPHALLLALESAHAYSLSSDVRAKLAVERATLLVRSEQHDDARELVEPLVADLTLPREARRDAARILVEDLIPPKVETLAQPDLELRARSLEVLTQLPSAGPAPEEAERWFLDLSQTREALAHDNASIAEPLESALGVVDEETRALEIRRRLVELYEQLGDWGQAEKHASVIAEADDEPEQWVQLSELRVWLDDRLGAQSALDRALELQPDSGAAHESLIRLAERTGESTSVITRLEAWAEVDLEGSAEHRARRLLRAATLAMRDDDVEKAALLAERAVTMVPRQDAALQSVAQEACAILAPAGLEDARIAILTRVVQEVEPNVTGASRLELADLLSKQDRTDEARTVIEQGVHRETPEHDPLIDRLIEETTSLAPDAAARRLLGTAERLGAGPAARRLRMAGAELAESAGEKETARTAWSNVVSEVGAAENSRAREALVRITRDLDDAPALLEALEEAALDASSPEARAAKLGEAADVAAHRLGDSDRALGLLDKAIGECPDDPALRGKRLELLDSEARWIDLFDALGDEVTRTTGEERSGFLERRASVATERLRDDTSAAELFLAAYDAHPRDDLGERALTAMRRTHDAAGIVAFAEQFTPASADLRTRVELAAADALEALGRVDDAIERLRRLVDARPDHARVVHDQRTLLHRHRRWPELAKALDASAARADVHDGVRLHLAAARIYADRVGDVALARSALIDALSMVERWIAEGAVGSETVSPVPAGSANLSERATFDAPLLDLSNLAEQLESDQLRVEALRLYAQSLSEGPAQWRALLLLASAERDTGDLDAAEFTLRGVVEAVRGSNEVSYADRVEAERSLGALLLDRGHIEDAIVALERAAKMLADVAPSEVAGGEAASDRAQVLALLASAYRTADRPRDAVEMLTAARDLAPDEVPEAMLDEAIEAAGTSTDLAELLERRATRLAVPKERASLLYEAARTWESLGVPERAFGPWIEAHRAASSNPKEAVRLQEALYEAERFEDLEVHLGRRLDSEELTDVQRATLHVSRARLRADRLDRLAEATADLERAAALVPQSSEVLSALADHAIRYGQEDVAADALARLATVATTEINKRRALARRARILLAADRKQGALQCLEEAVHGALTAGHAPRRLIERLAERYRDKQDYNAEATLWVRSSTVVEGAEAAAFLARGGDVRARYLDDRRGAMAAFEAAVRAAPNDLGLRRALIGLSRDLGDYTKAKHHAEAASASAKQSGDTEAAAAFENMADGSNAPTNGVLDEHTRSLRMMLDRSGRWTELADLEERRAADIEDNVARGEVLAEVGRLYAEGKTEELRARAKRTLERAIDANPTNVEALDHLARLRIEDQEWSSVGAVISRLESLGGPAWPAPQFALAAARVAQVEGDPRLAVARLVGGLQRDPGSIEVRRQLMGLAHLVEDRDAALELVRTYEAMLDPVLDVDLLGAVHAERSLLALANQDARGALREVERTLELTPSDERARRLRRRILEESGETHLLLDALEDEARESTDDEARRFLARALEIASSGEARRGRRVAAALERVAGDDVVVWERLFAHYRGERDGAGMLRALDRLPGLPDGLELDENDRISLTRSAVEADRAVDAARWLHDSDRERFQRIAVAALTDDAPDDVGLPRLTRRLLDIIGVANNPAWNEVIEALHELVPDDPTVASRLAESYDSDPSRAADAARIHRQILSREPGDLERIRRLAASTDAMGARAVLAWMEHGSTTHHASTGMTTEGSDPRLAGIASHVSAEVQVAPELGPTVRVQGGVVQIGEALAEEASPTELLFSIVRAVARTEGASPSEADRRALIVSGDVAGAIRALRRLEPRTWAEAPEDETARVACVRRWRPISDLVAFALSEEYSVAPSPTPARF